MDGPNNPEIDHELYQIIRESERYMDFTLLDKLVKFKDMFADMDIPYVQLHDTTICNIDGKKDIMGFSGVFEWKNNHIIPIDYDSYYSELMICGYEWFERSGEKCLDILVVGNW